MPCDPDAEAAILGSILIDPDVLDTLDGILVGGALDFYTDEHRTIYKAALALYTAGEPVDLITIVDRLRDMRKLEDVGGAAFVSALANQVPTSANAVAYARIVRKLALRRSDMAQASMLMQEAYTCQNDEAYDITRASILDSLALNAGGKLSEIPILTDEEAESLPPLKGILGNILFDESVSYLYGPSGRWKSFLALDWALSIATGRAWMGRPVAEGDVLYVCSEGARGIGKRITAWKRRHGIKGRSRLRVVPLALDLTNAAQVAALPRRLEALDIHPTLIVFDTLAASNSGDENTAVNAGAIDRAARRIIRTHEGACVLIVHHTGYDSSHMRGSTALFSNADTVIRITGGDTNKRIEPGEPITLISDKAKDGEPFKDIILTAEQERWASEDGVIHSSLVMVSGDEALAAAKADKAQDRAMTPERRATLDVLGSAGDEGMSASEWLRASGMGRSTFFNFLKYCKDQNIIELMSNGNYRMLASPVSPVQSNFSPTGPAKRSPVQSSVSLDTGPLDLARTDTTG